ncbi:hypothetical protein AVEN_64451-1 [Araneus ventricosus]|uniref:Uncharacterized protein n=1 Tax=Araneus ventricosus TaxID=182803 RepID=A0A4Y2RBH9_ARAVE|nr:hypothetical protein AVEN_64451-1 [Araneus ventricosus]
MRFSQNITAHHRNLQKMTFNALQKYGIVTQFYHKLCLATGLRDLKVPGSKPESCKSAIYASLVDVESDKVGLTSSRWFGTEVWRGDASSSAFLIV